MASADVRLVDRYGCPRAERDLAREAAAAAAAFAGRAALAVSLLLTDDAEIAGVHDQHLGDPTETDVVSFEVDAGAEVVVNVDRAAREAARRGVPRAAELALYVVHGVLHVCGFDDIEADARMRMRGAERAVLSALGVPIAAVD